MDFSNYTLWSAYAAIAIFLLTIIAFIFKWGFRFRLVGITGFMGVLTIGLLGLSLGLFDRAEVAGSVPFTRVYDNGANQVVINVSPTITPTQLEATLLQAANTYRSYGRGSQGGDNKMTIRARTLIHPQPNLSKPLYLGQVRRTLGVQKDDNIKVEIDKKAIAQLPKINTQK
ncbi:MAG: Ycf51 family protein [Microcystaceae cyanobacterium]